IGLGLLNLRALGARSLADHQLMVVAVGAGLFLLVQRFRAASLRLLGWGCYAVSIVLLLAVAVTGDLGYGARRWLSLGSFTLQPSELATVGVLIVLAHVLGTERACYR